MSDESWRVKFEILREAILRLNVQDLAVYVLEAADDIERDPKADLAALAREAEAALANNRRVLDEIDYLFR